MRDRLDLFLARLPDDDAHDAFAPVRLGPSGWIGAPSLRPAGGHPIASLCRPSGCWWCASYDQDLADLLEVERYGPGRQHCNALLAAGVRSVDDLAAYRLYPRRGGVGDELADIRNLGPEGVAYVRSRLDAAHALAEGAA